MVQAAAPWRAVDGAAHELVAFGARYSHFPLKVSRGSTKQLPRVSATTDKYAFSPAPSTIRPLVSGIEGDDKLLPDRQMPKTAVSIASVGIGDPKKTELQVPPSNLHSPRPQ
jgi:hypothetical protein